jgi:hypothetical protein
METDGTVGSQLSETEFVTLLTRSRHAFWRSRWPRRLLRLVFSFAVDCAGSLLLLLNCVDCAFVLAFDNEISALKRSSNDPPSVMKAKKKPFQKDVRHKL